MEDKGYKMVYKIKDNKESLLFYENKYKEILDDNQLRILGKEFVKNNRNKGKLVINNKKCELKEFMEINDIKNNNELKIGIVFSKNIYNRSDMFNKCVSLLKFYSFNDNYNHIEEEVYEYLVEEDENLIDNYNSDNDINDVHSLYNNLKDNKKIINSQISEQKNKYSNCSIISDWNNNLINSQDIIYVLTGLFYDCSSLISLPDISKWNINNVTNINNMFHNCLSLISLPDISKWNVNNVTDINDVFRNCLSLISLQEISKWNNNSDTNMYQVFNNCYH